MAILVTAINPAGTREQDQEAMKGMNLEANPPKGALLRLAGSVENGWRILSVWESREAFEAFRNDRLEPFFRQVGRPLPTFEFSPLESVTIMKQG